MDGETMLIAVFVVMNLIGFFIMGEDKKRARNHQFRISERTLWLVAVFGGAIGSTAGMQVFRHKTKHFWFKIGFPVLAVIDFILIVNSLM